MALKAYTITEGGIDYTVQLEEETAKQRGLIPADEQSASKPARKGKTPPNKAAQVETK